MSTRTNSGENFLAMSVSNIGFLLDRLGQDCHPLQFLRELTQNSIEAIIRSGQPNGEIIWDVDWTTFDLEGIQKLCITDNGDGMTGDEMVKFINALSSSMSEQSMSGNYGVGAKITAATRNPAGVLYLSWKDKNGSMIHMNKDATTAQYGLKQWEHKNGTYDYFLPIEDAVKPDLINDHGTKVVLLGNSPDSNTMQAPQGVASPSRWISKYLNTRFFEFPSGITIKAREGWEYPRTDKDRNYLRRLTGQAAYLKEHSSASGQVILKDGKAWWWILKNEPAITNNSGYVESSGHAGALYHNELYELATSRAGMSRLQQFGITFGYKYVVVYVEPTVDESRITTNTARTNLLIHNEALPWNEWAAEFRDKLPAEIAKLVSENAPITSTDHQKSIRDRLKDIMDLFKISRYRPTPEGKIQIDEASLVRGGAIGKNPRSPSNSETSIKTSSAGGGTGGNVYAVFEKVDGINGKKVNPDPFPEVTWVSIKDGTREYGVIEDRAAKYLADQNRLLINADFSVFMDMIKYFKNEYADVAGVAELTEDTVRQWFEQTLVETIIGVQGLMNRKEWTPGDIDKALSEEALTTSIMQRYNIFYAIKRQISAKVGSLKI